SRRGWRASRVCVGWRHCSAAWWKERMWRARLAEPQETLGDGDSSWVWSTAPARQARLL
ncbi:hypothetical protein HispidOSU_031560, partial [Sigmodon hispidus]